MTYYDQEEAIVGFTFIMMGPGMAKLDKENCLFQLADPFIQNFNRRLCSLVIPLIYFYHLQSFPQSLRFQAQGLSGNLAGLIHGLNVQPQISLVFLLCNCPCLEYMRNNLMHLQCTLYMVPHKCLRPLKLQWYLIKLVAKQ